MRKEDTKMLSEIYEKAIASSSIKESYEGHEVIKGKTDAYQGFLAAQTVNKPLVELDGSEIEGTVYLGEGYYIRNFADIRYGVTKGEELALCFVPQRSRLGDDGSMMWSDYMAFDDAIKVTPEILKLAASAVDKV